MEYFRTLATSFFLLLLIVLIACNLDFGDSRTGNSRHENSSLAEEVISISRGYIYSPPLRNPTSIRSNKIIKLANFKIDVLKDPGLTIVNGESGQDCYEDEPEISPLANTSFNIKSIQSFDFIEFPTGDLSDVK